MAYKNQFTPWVEGRSVLRLDDISSLAKGPRAFAQAVRAAHNANRSIERLIDNPGYKVKIL